jgi:hypothetical protein
MPDKQVAKRTGTARQDGAHDRKDQNNKQAAEGTPGLTLTGGSGHA